MWQIIEAGTFLKSAGDTFLVIGANTGSNSNDPMWKSLKSQKQSSYSVFVEPIPPFFKQLERNIKEHDLPTATCVNAAISINNEPLKLFCTGLDDNGEVIQNKGFSKWCAQTCTSNKTKLYNSQLNTRAMVDQYMKEYTVPGMSVRQLIDTYAKDRTIRAIQIDVEGLDDMVGIVKILLCYWTYTCIACNCLHSIVAAIFLSDMMPICKYIMTDSSRSVLFCLLCMYAVCFLYLCVACMIGVFEIPLTPHSTGCTKFASLRNFSSHYYFWSRSPLQATNGDDL